MNLVADFLFLAAGIALIWAALALAQRLPVFPLRQVVVEAPPRQVTAMQIEYAVRDAVSGNFFTVNPDTVRAAFEKLPWVRRADVRRHWPDTLDLRIEEHQAVARWKQQDGESRLVNQQGEVFAAGLDGDLPTLSGPEGAAAEVLNRYREFNASLAPLGRIARAVLLSPRLAWQLVLDDGMVLDLGREDAGNPVALRVARFVASYPEIRRKLAAPVARIDMRYPNGFSVRAAAPDNTGRISG